MRKEWPNVVPQPLDVSIRLTVSIAIDLTIGRMAPFLSLHEKRGSVGPAGTTTARFLNASNGQIGDRCGTRKMDWISPGRAVLAAGKSKRTYGLPSRSCPNNTCCLDRQVDGLNADLARTVASPSLIIPQKAHVAMAQRHASKGSDSVSAVRRASSMGGDIGGRTGLVREPIIFSRPLSDHLMQS
jgi:hypothetical protein